MSAIVDKPRLPGAFRYSGKYRRSIRNEYPDQLGHPGYIYCIGSNDFDPVKIGFTVGSPGKRVKEIQTGNPFELEVLFYVPAGDLVTYRFTVPDGAVEISAELLFQTVPPSSMDVLSGVDTAAARTFTAMMKAKPPIPERVSNASTTVP